MLNKARKPAISCIVLSGYGKFQYAQDSLKLGAKDYLLKPIERDDLFAALENVKQSLQTRKQESFLQVQKTAVSAVDQAIAYSSSKVI
jgi:two-component system response regulator YesN